MAHRNQTASVPKWTLLLFDSDGCTLATRTSNLDVQDISTIRPSKTVLFRFGKETLLAEILTLGDTKEALDNFEIDWEISARSQAIEDAKVRGDVDGYLTVHEMAPGSPLMPPFLPADTSMSDLLHLETRMDQTVERNYPEILSDIQQLKENQQQILANQQLILTNHHTLNDLVLEISQLLQTRLKKAKHIISMTETISLPAFIESKSKSSSQPKLPPSTCTESTDPTPQTPSTPPPSTPPPSTPPPSTPPPSSTPHSTPPPSLPPPSTSPSSTSLQPCRSTADSVETDLLEQEDFPDVSMESVHTPIAAPHPKNQEVFPAEVIAIETQKVNIGSIRNPVVIKRTIYEKACKLQTPQRFILALVEEIFSADELSKASVLGGVSKYRGKEVSKQPLCPVKLTAIYKQASLLFDVSEEHIQHDREIRNAVNAKCRQKKGQLNK